MFNIEQMQQFVWSQFAKAAEQWPPEVREAMRNIEVDVVKRPGRIDIVTRSAVENDENVEKTKDVLLTQLMQPISRVIGAFQCKVTTYQ